MAERPIVIPDPEGEELTFFGFDPDTTHYQAFKDAALMMTNGEIAPEAFPATVERLSRERDEDLLDRHEYLAAIGEVSPPKPSSVTYPLESQCEIGAGGTPCDIAPGYDPTTTSRSRR